MSTATIDSVVEVLPHPRAPLSLEDTGLPKDLLLQLVLKHLHFAGELSGHDLARRMGLRFPVIDPVIDQLKAQHHIAIVGGAMTDASGFRYRITDEGRVRVGVFLRHNQYVGVAPVPLGQYKRYLAEWHPRAPKTATVEAVRHAFSHLVLSEKVLDQLGPAINAGHSLFVYGPPGNGKSVISQAIRNLLAGDLAVPEALEVEGHIIRLYDPVNHEPLPLDEPQGLDAGSALDRRWVRCRRPMVVVGGELTLDSLELTYNEVSGFYNAPVQTVANGGVLVIDDFGRQKSRASDFLNRWIVPLENRVDFLTLKTGQKFDVPFMTLAVFATNIKPSELVDEAFLRRIRYKVFAESPSVEDFIRIFEMYSSTKGVAFNRALVEELLQSYYRPRRIPLRGCHPRDLIEQALSLAEYLGQPPRLSAELLEAACGTYFVDDREVPPSYA